MTEKIGKYRIDGKLGSGAMGVVYRAYDDDIARVVALKTIRVELLDGHSGAELVARFRNEAQASGRLVHPNIVAVYDYGEADGVTYIAMEYVDGRPLNDFLTPEVPMDLSACVACMSQLLAALDYAHARGVVHRDIKPANLLITPTAQVKITDFGVAKIESSTLTQVGDVIGTPSYMSPEQFRGERVDGRSDIFAAGILLYQMLTGARPFTGAASVVMHQILNTMPSPPSERHAGLHPAFDAVLARALAKRVEDRFQTARGFLTALTDAHLQHTGGVPPGEEDNERTVLAFSRPAPRPAPPPHTGTGGQHHSAASGAASASGAAGGAGASVGHTASLSASSPQWLVEVAPELQLALSLQIGPMAKLLLKKEAHDAADLDVLCRRLLAHIPTEPGRAAFLASVQVIKRKMGLGTVGTTSLGRGGADLPPSQLSQVASGGTALQLSPEVMEHAQQKLLPYVGPIAKVLVKRFAKVTGDPAEFHRLLAAQLPNEQDRAKFLRELGA
ncbi:serine/threonine-protein kinase [Rugamonas apoptosis]|uniref:non-specific serine/threonine protein kinase n=1 Tax=Rugamonas apoptosis TaxID=2758570 RepID=A0A7W2FA58_9BURK|nr:serine/threonine-protein kinase [Rugamonas apoptosis]MBA5687854.1 serine/threonine protein kinase [Rugamonas apoptosis]